VEQNRGGVRNLLDIPEMRELAYSAQVLSLVKPVLGEGAFESGDVLLMRPLVIHASSAAETPQHRRVIHFDYANVGLAEGLEWREDTALNS
jgi:ectoine hydroxylase-related dioxygenase (phytanoyl-CoA dioxygenase family)